MNIGAIYYTLKDFKPIYYIKRKINSGCYYEYLSGTSGYIRFTDDILAFNENEGGDEEYRLFAQYLYKKR
jgi:hypothetical protein